MEEKITVWPSAPEQDCQLRYFLICRYDYTKTVNIFKMNDINPNISINPRRLGIINKPVHNKKRIDFYLNNKVLNTKLVA